VNLIKSRIIFSLAMFTILLVLMASLWLRYDTSVKQFETLQSTLMQRQAEQAAKAINETVSYIRNQMSAISVDELWLNDFERFTSDVKVQENLARKFKLFFPKMFSYVLANAHGNPIGGDYDFFIEQSCQNDIDHVATMFAPDVDYFEYEPYIHPKTEAYHFDVMMPVFVKNREMIFFMSFSAKLLSDRLAEERISEHSMFLLRKDVPGLIEVSTEGVRDQLKREIKLSASELASVYASVDVPHSRWKVVVLENSELVDKFKQHHLTDMIITMLVLFLFWGSVFWLGLQHEISRGRLVSHLNHMSHHDELTGLANRRKLLAELKYAIDDVRYRGELSALIFLDLNDFKQVNDEYGHKVGDEVLLECAKRLQKLTRSGDVVARLGGDEFVILLNNLGLSRGKALQIVDETVQRLRKQLSHDYRTSGAFLKCHPSLGMILVTAKDQDAVSLLKDADEKMYQDKVRVKSSENVSEPTSMQQK